MGQPTTILRVEDTLICAGIEPMIIPTAGAHVRSAEIRIPAKFAGRPTVTGTVHGTKDPEVFALFGIYSIKVNEIGSQTQVAIQAGYVQKGVAIEGDFVCHYIVIGKAA
jgi:hypothetical protein